ncbi:MAG: ABC transporter ATP-binding protein [Candidatus Eremiobacteraeota bacterium]|nr:ABC transporter ATP-binding protein [Candidatus Eremiobacteraeota bacterium]
MIEVDNLEFTYPGADGKAIKGIGFNIEKGEIFGFLGPSGAGKTTTQKIIIGLLKGWDGKVNILGKDLNKWKTDLYEKIGIGFEAPNHYLKLTAMENLNLFRSLYSGETDDPLELLKIVGLEKDANTRVSSFSKGMKMRLNFARSLLNKPELWFLDEPTTGLDPVNAKNIRNIVLKKREEGATIFLTTHNMTVADKLCDRVGFIVDGEIKIIESPRQLKIQESKNIVRVEYLDDGKTQMKEFPMKDIGENREFIDLIKSDKIETIHSQEATLEDIFIKVTGRSLS